VLELSGAVARDATPTSRQRPAPCRRHALGATRTPLRAACPRTPTRAGARVAAGARAGARVAAGARAGARVAAGARAGARVAAGARATRPSPRRRAQLPVTLFGPTARPPARAPPREPRLACSNPATSPRAPCLAAACPAPAAFPIARSLTPPAFLCIPWTAPPRALPQPGQTCTIDTAPRTPTTGHRHPPECTGANYCPATLPPLLSRHSGPTHTIFRHVGPAGVGPTSPLGNPTYLAPTSPPFSRWPSHRARATTHPPVMPPVNLARPTRGISTDRHTPRRSLPPSPISPVTCRITAPAPLTLAEACGATLRPTATLAAHRCTPYLSSASSTGAKDHIPSIPPTARSVPPDA